MSSINTQHLQSIIDHLDGMRASLKLIENSEAVRDLESTEGFQDLTDHRLSRFVLNLNAYVRALRQAKEEIENPPDNSEFDSALSQVFGGFF